MPAMDYTYRYPYSSELREVVKGHTLQLASFNPKPNSQFFFDADILSPQLLGMQLSLLHRIVQTHFFKPMPADLDPVVTCHTEQLRFEGFSGCCGVYVRLDANTDSFNINHLGRGTTNVDFNAPMQTALAKLAGSGAASLQIGADELVLQQPQQQVVEKRVKLPLRWLKGFGEVQWLQSQLQHAFTLKNSDALSWFRQIAKGRTNTQSIHVTVRGTRLFSSTREQNNGVKISGLNRIKPLEPLLSLPGELSVWSNNRLGISAWSVSSQLAHFTLVVSPDLYRGFSGEGQLLTDLVHSPQHQAKIRAQLQWQSQLDCRQLAKQLSMSDNEVSQTLQQLSAEGILGYDLFNEGYFHRELPFDFSSVKQTQPRLKSARKLFEKGAVEPRKSKEKCQQFQINSKDTRYLVTLSQEGDQCNCHWFSRYKGDRGPCKHILAAQLYRESHP